jgi:hypothetical protein
MAWIIGGVWEFRTSRKPWLRSTRDINEALRAIKFDPKQRHQKNIGMTFALAQWGMDKRALPKKALTKFMEDGDLFDTLRIYGEVPANTYGFCDLPPDQLAKLEKRLGHHWPNVRLMIDAMSAPERRLKAANDKRRKVNKAIHNPRQSLLSASLAQFNS